MPEDDVRLAVDVFEELPRQARLADTADADNGDEVGFAVLDRCLEEILDLTELAVASGERRFETGRLVAPTDACDHAHSSPKTHRLGFSLEGVRAGVLVHDRGVARAPRRFTHEDGPRLCGRLHARR